jgi:hypothetical protein
MGFVFEGPLAEPGLAATVTLTVHVTTTAASFFTSSKKYFPENKNSLIKGYENYECGIFKTI